MTEPETDLNDILDRVEALPKRWRERADAELDEVAASVMNEFADELEEVLRGES